MTTKQKCKAPTTAIPADGWISSPAPRTVLIVEDDPDALSEDCRVIGAKFPVLAAMNADDALRIARASKPSVIVLDVMLPDGKDGFSVFRELRQNPATREIPVIFLTAVNQVTGLNFDEKLLGQYLNSAPADFINKPVTARALLSSIDRALKESGIK